MKSCRRVVFIKERKTDWKMEALPGPLQCFCCALMNTTQPRVKFIRVHDWKHSKTFCNGKQKWAFPSVPFAAKWTGPRFRVNDTYCLHPVAVKVDLSLLFAEGHQPPPTQLVLVILPHRLHPILTHSGGGMLAHNLNPNVHPGSVFMKRITVSRIS